ncbi:LamG-like jellyroll fold domain-containing protein [Streptomyces sp. TRM76323]|uniref:LamG-like jellyroll fold domain-containing protein n=1 Tax=Streptomyces tamarix TaxID=3078565 RepID=A0ABU3QSZ1_9ACTN|nr:LamG-like jellyroll fold domain-containing protein [Streptomyces tamarix]MDT9685854.1 LamG-like jellyroll fold domain-containing protein [Streptomyces tamarix]
MATGNAFAHPADDAAAATTAQRSGQPGASDASALAAESGEPVEVVSERTEYTTTTANPDGTYTLTQSTRPQRVRGEDGGWRSVDVTLERRSDGTVGPKAAVADVAFSGGGDKDLLRLGGERGSVTMRWHRPLPEPVLDGATATYPEVFPGTDLRLTATDEGYREVLVVKTPEAAANPALRKIDLTVVGDGLDIVPGAGGGVRAVDEDGNTVFAGPAGQMWDSAGDEQGGPRPQTLSAAPAGTPAGQERGPGAPSSEQDDAHPGQGDASAVLPVTVAADTVTVRPDPELLRGEDTVFPVYIDPPMGLALDERTVLSSDGDRFYDFDGDHGVGNCNRLGPWYCGSDYTNRMYFEFAPTNLSGKYVIDATFRAYETWSFSCTSQWVDLWRTNNISEGTRWPGPAQLDLMGDRDVSAGRGTACDPEQPDSWVEFSDNPEETDENLTSTVRSFADGKFPRLTLMLRAKDENDPDAWKRFDDNAQLQINYVPKPGLPSPYGIVPGNGTTRYCNPNSGDPLIITTATPRVQAAAQTLVQPASNAFKGSLKVYFDAERYDPNTAKWIHTWDALSPSYRSDGHLETIEMSHRADQILYRARMQTRSYWMLDGKTLSMSSAYTPWCYFKTDTTAPKAPQITSNGPYVPCLTDDCPATGAPGRAGLFTFRPNPADVNATTGATDIAGYRYRLITQTGASTVNGGSPAAQSVTPTLAGTHVLTVEARDVRERYGQKAEYVFKVAPGQGAVGRWQFADPPQGTATSTTTKDTATEGTVRHDAALSGGAAWSERSRRGAGDHALDLNSTDPAKQEAYAATTGPAVNTRDSFTVSTWAYLTDTATNHVVLSAPGAQDSAFTLYYSSGYGRWAFNRGSQDLSSSPDVISFGDTLHPPTKVWTHLAGVFDTKGTTDKTDDTIHLFVNGRPQGQPMRLSATAPAYEPWASSDGLQIGRTKSGGVYQQYFRGYVDETAVWQRALNADEIRQESQARETATLETPATELVAHWNAEGASGTQIAETSGYGRPALTLSAEGAQLVEGDDGTELRLDGAKGHAQATGPVVDETGSFTVSARVRLDSARLAARPVGSRSYVIGQATPAGGESSWALWVEKTSEETYRWRFGRTATDAAGKVLYTVWTSSQEPAELDTWVQVTGVFDHAEETETGHGNVRLYLGAAGQASYEPTSFTAPTQGSGTLTAGRGTAKGTSGHFLPGAVSDLRVWTGAMIEDQIDSKVLGNPGDI